jgi:hypothetical protein
MLIQVQSTLRSASKSLVPRQPRLRYLFTTTTTRPIPQTKTMSQDAHDHKRPKKLICTSPIHPPQSKSKSNKASRTRRHRPLTLPHQHTQPRPLAIPTFTFKRSLHTQLSNRNTNRYPRRPSPPIRHKPPSNNLPNPRHKPPPPIQHLVPGSAPPPLLSTGDVRALYGIDAGGSC